MDWTRINTVTVPTNNPTWNIETKFSKAYVYDISYKYVQLLSSSNVRNDDKINEKTSRGTEYNQ
jgi:hypothetical protein